MFTQELNGIRDHKLNLQGVNINGTAKASEAPETESITSPDETVKGYDGTAEGAGLVPITTEGLLGRAGSTELGLNTIQNNSGGLNLTGTLGSGDRSGG